MGNNQKSDLLWAASLTILLGAAVAVAGTPKVYQGASSANGHFKNVVTPGKELKGPPSNAPSAKKAMLKYLADKKAHAPKRDLATVLARAKSDQERQQMKTELAARVKAKKAFVIAEAAATADAASTEALANARKKAKQIRACKKAGGAKCE